MAALTIPFAGKPFHVDDDIYIKGAAQILADPWNPLGGTQRLLGEVMPTYHFTQHPPLLSYYMALISRVTGGLDERTLHLAFLGFPMLAAAAMYALARRFTEAALPTTLLLATTPAFLVLSHGVMTDVPFLAFVLGTAASVVYGVDRGEPRLLALGGALLSVACFLQYRAVVLIPLLWLYAWLCGRGARRVMFSCVPAVVLLALWSWHNVRYLGVVHALDAGSWIEFRPSRLAGDALAYVAFLGGGTLFPLFLLYVARARFASPARRLVGLGAVGLAAVLITAGYTASQRALFAIFLACGLAGLSCLVPSPTLLRAARQDARARDSVFLSAAALLPLTSQVLLNIFASVRSLLIALPFAVLLLARRVEAEGSADRRRRVLWAGVGATAFCGLAVAIADFRYAAAAREIAIRASIPPPGGHRLWFTGEWGFRYYIERAGATSVTSHGDGVKAGDWLVAPEVPSPAWLAPGLVARLQPIDTFASRDAFPMKLMSFRARAGFYSNFWGPLPYSFSNAPLEQARVFRFGVAPE